MHLCRCKDSMIKGCFGDTMLCALGCSLFLISGLSIVQIYLNMAFLLLAHVCAFHY
jgi:hypothetical protein